MPKNISWRKLVQIFMIKQDFKIHIPNPHRSDISKHLLAEILRQAEISTSDWDKI